MAQDRLRLCLYLRTPDTQGHVLAHRCWKIALLMLQRLGFPLEHCVTTCLMRPLNPEPLQLSFHAGEWILISKKCQVLLIAFSLSFFDSIYLFLSARSVLRFFGIPLTCITITLRANPTFLRVLSPYILYGLSN